jgi:putative acetyltransferase
MQVRHYRDTDLQPVAGLFTASVHRLASCQYDAAQLAAWAPQPPDLDEWRERLRAVRTLVAEEDGELAGFVSYEPNGHIDLLFTAPGFSRRGVATTLYGRAETLLVSLGVAELFTEASLVARPFFERQGFRIVAVQRVILRGVAFERLAMRKQCLRL